MGSVRAQLAGRHKNMMRAIGDHLQPRRPPHPAAATPAAAAERPAALALPPRPLDRSTDLPGATQPGLTPAEVARFKEWGFVVKRGLVDPAGLLPYVDALWATTETPRFNWALNREDAQTWVDPGERWENWQPRGHGRDLVHLTPNSQWRWHGLGHDPEFVRDTTAFSCASAAMPKTGAFCLRWCRSRPLARTRPCLGWSGHCEAGRSDGRHGIVESTPSSRAPSSPVRCSRPQCCARL